MATPREYVQSIMASLADLQNRTDGDLRLIDQELKDADDILSDAIYNLDNPVEDSTVRRTDGS